MPILLVECVDCKEECESQAKGKARCHDCFSTYYRRHAKKLREQRQKRIIEAMVEKPVCKACGKEIKQYDEGDDTMETCEDCR